ncbi:MAG: trigger factor [Anaerolineae bacterium]
MKVTTATIATREVELTIEPEQEIIARAMRKAAQTISRYRPLPGYRPGKAPYATVERIYGKETILDEAVRELAEGLYRQAIEEAKIEPFEAGHLDVESKDPLVLKVHVSLVPEVSLGDYRALHLEPEPVPSISEEEIDKRIELIQRQHAEYNPVERPAQIGDQIVASTKGFAEGAEVVNREDQTLVLADALQPAGYAEALQGMSVNEERTFTLHYSDDYSDSELAGKDVTFTVTMKTVRETRLPELNDDLAKMAGDYATLDALRTAQAERLKNEADQAVQQKERDAAVALLVGQAQVEYPATALQHEIEGSINRQKTRLQQYGFTWPKYLEMIGKTEEQMREDIRPEAEKALIRRLVINQFAEDEKLDISNEEMTTGLSNLAAAYGDRAQEIINQMKDRRALVSFYGDLLMDKSLRHLTALLTGRLEPEAVDAKEDEAIFDSVEAETLVTPEPAQTDATTEAVEDVSDVPVQDGDSAES